MPGEGILTVGEANSVLDEPPGGSQEGSKGGVSAEGGQDGAASA